MTTFMRFLSLAALMLLCLPGCGGTTEYDIPVLDAEETKKAEAEVNKAMEVEMKKQMEGNMGTP